MANYRVRKEILQKNDKPSSLTSDAIFRSRVESPQWRHPQPPIRPRIIRRTQILPLNSSKYKQVLRLATKLRPRFHGRPRLLELLGEYEVLEPLVHRSGPEQARKRHVGGHSLQEVIREEAPQSRVEKSCRDETGSPELLRGLRRGHHPSGARAGELVLHRCRAWRRWGRRIEAVATESASAGLVVAHLVTHPGGRVGRYVEEPGERRRGREGRSSRAVFCNSLACQAEHAGCKGLATDEPGNKALAETRDNKTLSTNSGYKPLSTNSFAILKTKTHIQVHYETIPEPTKEEQNNKIAKKNRIGQQSNLLTHTHTRSRSLAHSLSILRAQINEHLVTHQSKPLPLRPVKGNIPTAPHPVKN